MFTAAFLAKITGGAFLESKNSGYTFFFEKQKLGVYFFTKKSKLKGICKMSITMFA